MQNAITAKVTTSLTISLKVLFLESAEAEFSVFGVVLGTFSFSMRSVYREVEFDTMGIGMG